MDIALPTIKEEALSPERRCSEIELKVYPEDLEK
jgi:hypothetical protein